MDCCSKRPLLAPRAARTACSPAARNRTGQHEACDVEAGQHPDAKDYRIEQHERLASLMVQRVLVSGDLDACGQIFGRSLLGNTGLRTAQNVSQLRARHATRQARVEHA